MYFAGKMKLNPRVVRTLGIQEPFALSQVHEVTVFVFGNIGLFLFYKIFQLFGIGTGEPAGFIKRQAVHLNGCAILLQ